MNPLTNNSADSDIVLVEDDLELSQLTQEYLSKNGFNVIVIHDGLEASRRIPEINPALVILDIMLPNLTGMEVCKLVREQYRGFILMLTALDEDMDQMLGLELGADDYIIKPVQPRLLLSRIKAVLRRSRNSSSNEVDNPILPKDRNQIIIGHLSVQTNSRKVCWKQQEITLTTGEYDLLTLLAHRPDEIIHRDLLARDLRGVEYDGLDRTIDRKVSRLRKKLENFTGKNPIKTVRAKGYLLSSCELKD